MILFVTALKKPEMEKSDDPEKTFINGDVKMKSFFNPEPEIFAIHGGIPGLPPLSMEALRKARDFGADVIAVRACLTKDRRIAVVPEYKLEKISNGTGNVSDLEMNELIKLDAAYMFNPPGADDYPFRNRGYAFYSLEHMLEEFPEQRFNIELVGKNEIILETYSEILKKMKASDRVFTLSYNKRIIGNFRKQFPDAASSMSLNGIVGFYALFRMGLLSLKNNFEGDAIQIPEVIGSSYIANQGFIHQAAQKKIRVHVLDVTSDEQIKRLFEAGVSGFFSKDIVNLKNRLNELKENTGNTENPGSTC